MWLSFSCLQFRHCQPRQVYGCAIEHGNIVLNADTAAWQQLFHQGPVDTGLVWTLPKLRQQYGNKVQAGFNGEHLLVLNVSGQAQCRVLGWRRPFLTLA